jgi:small subunit ribosomal protein S6e
MGLSGYELKITGGSDNCGFPMRGGILGVRKRLTLLGGVGLRESFAKGIRKKKTVCGHKVSSNIVQINLKITKEGAKPLAEIFPPKEAEKKE